MCFAYLFNSMPTIHCNPERFLGVCMLQLSSRAIGRVSLRYVVFAAAMLHSSLAAASLLCLLCVFNYLIHKIDIKTP